MGDFETNPRRLSLQILADVERGRFARDMLEEASYALGQATADLRLVHELVYGVIRMRLLLDTVIGHFSKIKVRKLEKHMLQALRIGLYQVFFMDRVPQSAAVNEAVKLVAKEDDKRPGNFCNAVLRNVTGACRLIPGEETREIDPTKSFQVSEKDVALFDRRIFSDPDEDPVAYVSQKFSHPPELVARWLESYPLTMLIPICRADNRRPPLHVRINRLRASIKDVTAMLQRTDVAHRVVNVRTLHLSDPRGLRGEVFKSGMITVQDATAARAAPFLDPRPGEKVLDLCAAPGGKTTHIAELMNDEGTVIAVDQSEKGMARLEDNCRRMGVTCVKYVTEDGIKYLAKHRGRFDRVLLDVPCSNTGVLSRRVEARWRFSDAALQQLVKKQKALLKAAASVVKKGGTLVYSTCSIEPEENSLLISAFLEKHPEFRLKEQREFLQGREVGDGGYLARLTRIL